MPLAVQLDLGREMRGGQRQVFYLARHLREGGRFTPVVAAPRGAPLLAEAEGMGIRTLVLPTHREFSPSSFRALAKLLDEGAETHLVNTHCARSAGLAAILRMLARSRLRLIHTRRVSYPPKGWWGCQKYTWGERVVCVSAEIRDAMHACGVEEADLEVIHSGIDLSRYAPRDPSARRAGGRLTIGFIGALTRQKGCGTLLRALAKLSEREDLPAWKAMIVGDGPLRGELERLAGELGLSERVSFLGRKDSRGLLPHFDVLAAPSLDGEGSSGVVKEGWATRVPVVVSDLPSFLELVEHGKSGLVSRRGDADSLAQALARVLREPELAGRLASKGSERVREYTDRVMGGKYLALYDSLYVTP
ncbi:glycosyltransferase family 4 protein [Desulfohalovibrio reitneri]|uniref:glycosyltransferase family 4 protein n=1 Tax=Desulfohalovibrio reitneri TaxID=1307759 RepID=UPI0004A6F1E7|nr:glycosyltransferase family 4 protein [Desulfohalovibrio reitneri]